MLQCLIKNAIYMRSIECLCHCGSLIHAYLSFMVPVFKKKKKAVWENNPICEYVSDGFWLKYPINQTTCSKHTSVLFVVQEQSQWLAQIISNCTEKSYSPFLWLTLLNHPLQIYHSCLGVPPSKKKKAEVQRHWL